MNRTCKSGIVAALALAAVAWAGQDKGTRPTRWPILHSEPAACSSFAGFVRCAPQLKVGHAGSNLVMTLMDDAF